MLDWRGAPLSDRQRALLEFASLVNRDVHAVSRETLDAMRARGLRDVELLDTVHVVGFFNYYTRLADALGVDPEESMRRTPK